MAADDNLTTGGSSGVVPAALLPTEALRGLLHLAVETSPPSTNGAHDALRYLEQDVLNRWRTALLRGDAPDVLRLVSMGHAVQHALRAAPPAIVPDTNP